MNAASRTAAVLAAFAVFSGPAWGDDWTLTDRIDMPQTLDADPDADKEASGCEQYGEGAVRLGGTEACVRISGYVRFSISSGLD